MKNIIYFIFILTLIACSGNKKNKDASLNNLALLADTTPEIVYDHRACLVSLAGSSVGCSGGFWRWRLALQLAR